MVIRELVKIIEQEIFISDNPHFEAELIIMKALSYDRTKYLMSIDNEAEVKSEEKAFELAVRRKTGEPLAYILGEWEFMGLDFWVNENTLIPRADTETLVEKVINYIGDKELKVLDIGTGTGCIGISVAKFCKNADVTLLDISKEALDTAKQNAKRNEISVKTLECDILNQIPDDKFDVIISNPPYIRTDVIKTLQTDVKDFEPFCALDGGEDGLVFYRRIVDISKCILSPNGLLAFEIGYDQGEEVSCLMTEFKGVRVIKDLCHNDRVIIGFLGEQK